MRSERLIGPRQFRLIFVATMAVLSLTLAWLGWQLLKLDEISEGQRRTERREAAADMAVAVLEKRLTTVEQDLSGVLADGQTEAPSLPGDGAVIVRFTPAARQAWPAGALVYYPDLPEPTLTFVPSFDKADELEQKGDHGGAIAELRRLTAADSPIVRGLALVRMARLYLKANQHQKATGAFEQLTTLGAITVGGMPAALAGQIGVLTVHERQQDRTSMDRTARLLDRDLHSGRWPIGAAIYDYVSFRVTAAIIGTREASPDRVALSEAIEIVWRERQHGRFESGGRRSVTTSSGPVLIVWRSAGTTIAMFGASAAHLAAHWVPAAGAGVTLLDSGRRQVAGTAAVRHSGETGLPWTVALDRADDPDADQAFTQRRRLLAAGLGIVLGVIVTGAWFVGRSVSRELEAARLQSDFVSAVSHEFRTPLTTICQLSELLKRGRVASEADRQTYYEFLHGESDRLRRLVEGLLDFGRLQTGKVEFKLEAVDAAAFLRESAAEFSKAHPGITHQIVIHPPAASVSVQADREALRCALWNLLENAVKYSPDREAVHVEAARAGRFLEIAVRDEGIGIPRHEQRRIFDRFTRGAGARERHIGGTGIGLATAREIVRAHGGDIVVESEPGLGSTFTIRLPPRAVSKATVDDRDSSLAGETGR